MFLYCDTSALLKLYVQESGSEQMHTRARAASALVVCRMAWVEAMSALGRRSREHPADTPTIDQARDQFKADWPAFAVLEVTAELAELAGEYAEMFALRAYDSVQLAALRTLQQSLAGDVGFACFDNRLRKAAGVLGVTTE